MPTIGHFINGTQIAPVEARLAEIFDLSTGQAQAQVALAIHEGGEFSIPVME